MVELYLDLVHLSSISWDALMIRSIKGNHHRNQDGLGEKDFNTFKLSAMQAGASAGFLQPLIDGCE